MEWLKTLFDREAALAGQLATAVFAVAAALGWFELSTEAVGSILGLLLAVGVILSRRFSWSKESVEDVVEEARRSQFELDLLVGEDLPDVDPEALPRGGVFAPEALLSLHQRTSR